MYFYKKDVCDGRWLFMEEGSDCPIRSFKNLSIIYHRTELPNGQVECSLLKHGSKERVENWMRTNKPKYESVGLELPLFIDVHSSVSADDVNFILERSCIQEKYFDRLRHPVIEAEVVPPVQKPNI